VVLAVALTAIAGRDQRLRSDHLDRPAGRDDVADVRASSVKDTKTGSVLTCSSSSAALTRIRGLVPGQPG